VIEQEIRKEQGSCQWKCTQVHKSDFGFDDFIISSFSGTVFSLANIVIGTGIMALMQSRPWPWLQPWNSYGWFLVLLLLSSFHGLTDLYGKVTVSTYSNSESAALVTQAMRNTNRELEEGCRHACLLFLRALMQHVAWSETLDLSNRQDWPKDTMPFARQS